MSRPAVLAARPSAVLLAAAFAALSVLAGCHKPAEAPPEPIRPVRVERLAPRGTDVALELAGDVRPRIESRLGFRVGGKIAARLVEVGQPVRPGQVLARLDPQDVAPAIAAAAANLEAARTDLKLARAERERVAELRAKSYVSAAQLDRAQATLDAAEARVLASDAQLASARNGASFQALVADVDGVVTAVEAEAGQVVTAGQPVIRIARGDARDVIVAVPETALGAVRGATAVEVSSPVRPGERLAAKVREWSPIADAASRTYAVKVALVSADDAGRLPLGASATVAFRRGTDAALVLPLSALHSRDADPRVWVVDEKTSTVRAVPVRIAAEGLRDDAVVLDASAPNGPRAGDLVVTAGANLLRAGQAVRLPGPVAASASVAGAGGAAAASTTAPATPASAPTGAAAK